MNTYRLDDILARQKAASEARVERESTAKAEQREAGLVRAAFEREWRQAQSWIEEIVDALNARTREHGIQIHRWRDQPGESTEALGRLCYGLTEHKVHGAAQILSINVTGGGLVEVKLGSAATSSAGSYAFPLAEAKLENWENVFLDFLDANIPRG